MLISFSGPDNSGKTTQIKKLLEYFKEQGLKTASIYDVMDDFDYHIGTDLNWYYERFKKYDVIHTRFRLHSDENTQVMNILEVVPLGNIQLTTISAYTAYYDYIHWRKYVLDPLLADGKYLICDKFSYDDIAFKSAFGCPYHWLRKLHYDTLKPDVGFYIQLKPETIVERNTHLADGRIVHYNSLINTKRLLYYYEQLVLDEGLIPVRADKTRDEIFNDILEVLIRKNAMPSL